MNMTLEPAPLKTHRIYHPPNGAHCTWFEKRFIVESKTVQSTDELRLKSRKSSVKITRGKNETHSRQIGCNQTAFLSLIFLSLGTMMWGSSSGCESKCWTSHVLPTTIFSAHSRLVQAINCCSIFYIFIFGCSYCFACLLLCSVHP